MNKNLKGLLIVAVVGAVVYFAAKKSGLLKSNKQIVIDRLDADFGFSENHKKFVNSADKEYIDAWAKAIKSNQELFFAQGKKFYTKGGSTVKS